MELFRGGDACINVVAAADCSENMPSRDSSEYDKTGF